MSIEEKEVTAPLMVQKQILEILTEINDKTHSLAAQTYTVHNEAANRDMTVDHPDYFKWEQLKTKLAVELLKLQKDSEIHKDNVKMNMLQIVSQSNVIPKEQKEAIIRARMQKDMLK